MGAVIDTGSRSAGEAFARSDDPPCELQSDPAAVGALRVDGPVAASLRDRTKTLGARRQERLSAFCP